MNKVFMNSILRCLQAANSHFYLQAKALFTLSMTSFNIIFNFIKNFDKCLHSSKLQVCSIIHSFLSIVWTLLSELLTNVYGGPFFLYIFILLISISFIVIKRLSWPPHSIHDRMSAENSLDRKSRVICLMSQIAMSLRKNFFYGHFLSLIQILIRFLFLFDNISWVAFWNGWLLSKFLQNFVLSVQASKGNGCWEFLSFLQPHGSLFRGDYYCSNGLGFLPSPALCSNSTFL